MARMKKCPECAHLNSVGELYCDVCGCSLSEDEVVEVNEQGEYPRGVKRPAERLESRPNDRDVGRAHDFPADPVPDDRSVFAFPKIVASLDFPWGPVRIDHQLNVGRDRTFSPIAGEIQDPHVSRRHAELHWDGPRLVVRHVGTTNPTFVNTKALAPGEEAPLGDGDRIDFSRHLTAVVRLKHTR
jgi:hypothetical protein